MSKENNQTSQKYYQAKRKKRKKPLMYFTMDTQDAIVRYNEESDDFKRNIIYEKEIYPALDKLAEITIHANKFYHFDTNFEDMKREAVTFMTKQLGKFDPNHGANAFSFFSVIVKRYLIVENKKNFNRMKKVIGMEEVNQDEGTFNAYMKKQETTELSDFFDMLVDFYDDNLTSLFSKQRDVKIADAVVNIFRNRENIENYNKKSIYVLIREHSDVKTQYITSVITRMQEQYEELFRLYMASGSLNTAYTAENDDTHMK